MVDESKVLCDDALEDVSGGCGNTSDWLRGWHPYDGSKGVYLCPKCMGAELEHFYSFGFERFRCAACKLEFKAEEAGKRAEGEF